jgi:hypothetical protein
VRVFTVRGGIRDAPHEFRALTANFADGGGSGSKFLLQKKRTEINQQRK